ncbi:MAG: hypothetical protein ACJ76S_06040 [Solirubrobacteraceae bacterium]
MWLQDSQRLEGMHLGKVERHLFRHASNPDDPYGYPLDARRHGRAAHETVLRAGRKLEHWGLIESERIPLQTRITDPRLEAPVYRDGGFWQHRNPRRRHIVYRKVVWKTAFGLQIWELFGPRLRRGLPVRWDPNKVFEATRRSQHWSNVPDREDRQRVASERRRWAAQEDDPEELEPLKPDFVSGFEGLQRWELCVGAGRRLCPKAGSARLWEKCGALYQGGTSTQALRILAGEADPPAQRVPRTATDQFLADPVNDLLKAHPRFWDSPDDYFDFRADEDLLFDD